MSMNNELKEIVTKFSESGWDLIDTPSRLWLENDNEQTKSALISAIEQANHECGSCGCEFDPLYKQCLDMLKDVSTGT